MKYPLEILQSDLNNELRALEIGKQATKGQGFYMDNATMEAFEESIRIAKERIPQLEKAIKLLNKSK